nr:cytochrome b [Paradiplozoon hemiculteri]
MLNFCYGVRFSMSTVVNRLDWPVNSNLNYWWCGGSVLLSVMLLQLVSGLFCAFPFLHTFVSHGLGIMVEGGPGPLLEGFSLSLVHFVHVWGASLLFFLLLIHIGRGVYYGSYSKSPLVWSIGMILYLLILVEAFLGYLLPWHQMSYWAGVVISSIFLSFPYVGDHLYNFIVGSYVFGDLIVSRVYCLHVSFGFVILLFVIVHLLFLHEFGSSNSFNSMDSYSDSVFFFKGYFYKDVFVIISVFFIVVLFSSFFPWMTSLKEGFMSPDFMSTPVNIKPEWYFLPFYAILRSIESKLGGLFLVCMVFFLVWLPSPMWFSCAFNVFRRFWFWVMVFGYLFLSVLGAMSPSSVCVYVSFFVYLLFIYSLLFIKLFDFFSDFFVWLFNLLWF